MNSNTHPLADQGQTENGARQRCSVPSSEEPRTMLHYSSMPNLNLNAQTISSAVPQSNAISSTSCFKSAFTSCFCFRCKSCIRTDQRLNRVLYLCRVFLTHLFSTTGLCFLVVVYANLGATLFQYLESSNKLDDNSTTIHEQLLKELTRQTRRLRIEQVIVNRRHHIVQQLWNVTQHKNVLYPDEWKAETGKQLELFEDVLVQAVQHLKYRASTGTSVEWSFSGSLLYSVTVITTIGEFGGAGWEAHRLGSIALGR